MDTAAFDSDRMLKLLTDALRRGPGSPEWHRAVSEVRDLNSPEADEYRILITARERLESAREYREVRAGPAFTRDLFGRLDESPTAGRRVSVAQVVRLLCLLTLVGALGYVAMLLAQGGGAHATEQLSGRLFVTQVRGWTFGSVPKDLHAVGPLPLEARGFGLRAGGKDTAGPTAGLLFSEEPLDLDRGTCLEMRLDFKPGPVEAQLALLKTPPSGSAVGEEATNVADSLAIVCGDTGVRFVSAAESSPVRPLSAGTHVLRIKVADGATVAEVDGQTIWSGRNDLGPRGFAAVRFVRDGKAGDTAVQSLRVLAP